MPAPQNVTSNPAAADRTGGDWLAAGLLLLGHGSARRPDAAAALGHLRDALAEHRQFAEVGIGYLAGAPDAAGALAGMMASRIYLLPCFIAAGYFSQVKLPDLLGLAGPLTRRGPRTLCYCEPLGESPGLSELAAAQALREARRLGLAASGATLLLVAHGTPRHPGSAENARRHAAAIAATSTFATVAVAFIEEPPMLPDMLAALAGRDVILVGLFAAEGGHGGADVTAAIAGEQSRRGSATGLLAYAGAVGAEPGMADLALAQVRDFDRRFGSG